MDKIENIDKYTQGFPAEIQKILEKLRETIQKAAPDATEAISYGMPTFKYYGNLVHFAAYKKHIGFYPSPTGIDAFMDEIAVYRTGKGTLQFPLDQPIPWQLIEKIVIFRVEENFNKIKGKNKSK